MKLPNQSQPITRPESMISKNSVLPSQFAMRTRTVVGPGGEQRAILQCSGDKPDVCCDSSGQCICCIIAFTATS